MQRYAIVDLEATDARSSNDKIEIIQVGIVILENGVIVDQFAADVNPHRKLSKKIKELTGLDDARLAEAPDFATLAGQIFELLKGSVFVAHNVKFDYSLLARSLETCGFKLDLQAVDTVELSRIFYPSFPKYGLETLDAALALRNDHPHAALSDALATAELLLQIQTKIRRLPYAVVTEILRHAGQLIADTAIIIAEELEYCAEDVTGLVREGAIATRQLTEKKVAGKVRANFSKNLSALGLTERPLQTEMAGIVSEELENGLPVFIEAPTGIGKTYAYLLPILAADRKIVVSTATKVLQKQLTADIEENLQDKLGLSVAALFGTQNYISLDKLAHFLRTVKDSKNTEIFKMKCLVWLTETLTGELSELSAIMTNAEMLSAVSHEGKVKTTSRYAAQDFWLRAQDEAATASVVVVNHAYLCERLTDDTKFLQGSTLVVDEAQQLFSVLEAARQSELAVVDEVLKVSIDGARSKQRLIESFFFQLGKKDLNPEKLRQDAEELGLAEVVDFLSAEDKIYWADGNVLKSSPKDFYNFQALLPPGVKSFFVSASIALSEKEPLLPELLGFDIYNFYKLSAPVAGNQLLEIVTDAPPVQNVSVQEYSEYVAAELTKLAALKQPIIVLFTSKLMMNWTAEFLSADKNPVSYQLQNDRQNRPAELKRKFDDGKFQILLGTGSFWEGVDFDKQDRAIIVIPRLPFATPDDSLTKKFAQKFNNPFYSFNLPMAVMRLRQAIGRTNRRPSQKSAIVVLDRRLAGKTYAKKMRKNLQEVVEIESDNFENAFQKVADFLKG